jgi:hypothetical protein
MKGFTDPQRAWRVLSENRVLGRFEPCVRRDAAGRRQVPHCRGIGRTDGRKNRLPPALLLLAAPSGQRGLSDDRPDGTRGPLRRCRRAKNPLSCKALLAVTTPPIEDVALLAELHGLPSVNIAPPLDVRPQRKKEKTFEALLRQVEGLLHQQPVLMVSRTPIGGSEFARTVGPRCCSERSRPEFQPPWIGQPVWSKYGNCRGGRKLSHCRVASSPMVRYHFVGIGGAHRGSVGGGGELMEWACILAYITGTVDQELLLRNQYLAAENRILKAQLQGRLRL